MSLRPYEQTNTSLHDLYQMYNPFAYPYEYTQHMMNRMTQMVDQSVERQFSKFNMSMPTLTLHEKNNVYQVETSLPGISPEDISISYKNGYVTVSGKKKTSTVSADGNSSSEYHQQFYNTIRVPGNPDTKLIKASTSHGLLTISIPK